MDCLKLSEFKGRIAWLGHVPTQDGTIRSEGISSANVSFDGFDNEVHSGATRAACVRVKMMHPEGTEIRNTRQLSILSAEECAAIAADMGVAELDPAWLGASIVIEGIPDFSHLPPASRLQTANGTTLTVDLENAPCIWPAKEIEKEHAGKGKAFKPAAKGRRGITAWVERPGALTVGDNVALFVPTQRGWQPSQP